MAYATVTSAHAITNPASSGPKRAALFHTTWFRACAAGSCAGARTRATIADRVGPSSELLAASTARPSEDQPERWPPGDRTGEEDRRPHGEADLRHHQESSPVPRVQDRPAREAFPPRGRGDRRARSRRPPPPIGEPHDLDEHGHERELAPRGGDEEAGRDQPELPGGPERPEVDRQATEARAGPLLGFVRRRHGSDGSNRSRRDARAPSLRGRKGYPLRKRRSCCPSS